MTTKVAPLGLRLFLEGIEVPVISASVNMLPDQPASATIQVIPTDMGMHLLPRTLVHLFYLDDEPLSNPGAPPRIAQDGSTENNLNRFDAPDEQYKILFTGEIIGFNYAKTPSSRQLVLQCLDLSTYWDTCYQWFADYSVGGNGLTDKTHNFVGAGKSLFNSIAGGHQWVIGRILNTKPKTAEYQQAKGLLSGVIHLLETIGGIKYRDSGLPGFNGVNDFFTIAELRYNMLGMLGALEEDETSAKMYANKAFRSWLRNGMTSLGTLLSFRDIINHVNKHIFHHIYPNPCARYLSPTSETATKSINVQSSIWTEFDLGLEAQAQVKKCLTIAGVVSQRMVSASFLLPIGSTGPLAAAGVGVSAEAISGALSNFNLAATDLRRIVNLLDFALEQVGKIKSDDKATIVTLITNEKVQAQTMLEELPEAGATAIALETSAAILVERSKNLISGLAQIIGMQQRTKSKKSKRVTTTTGSRFYTQLFLPETFFVAPPRCNVIFPDQYFQFQFSRNFMREVSRISMQAGLGLIQGGGRRGAKLLGRSYFAPNVKDTRGRNLFASPARGARILLPHEVHSGIIPKFEWVPDGHRWGLKAAKELDKKNEFEGSAKIAYLQRIANFQFFVHRWSARTMAISGHFNPRLVLGMPSLVMDRSLPAPAVIKQIEERLGRKWMSTQYLGKTVALSHTINQESGQTQAQFTHCRTHRGIDDEFVGVLFREVEKVTDKQFDVVFNTRDLLDSNSLTEEQGRKILQDPTGASLGSPGNKLIIKDREDLRALVKDYVEGTLSIGSTVKTSKKYKGDRVVKVTTTGTTKLYQAEAERQFGIDSSLATEKLVDANREDFVGIGASLFEFLGDEGLSTAIEVPAKFTITLANVIGTGTFRRSDRSIEEAITPAWYSTIWSNKEIGKKVYGPLLGCEAIVDNVSLEQKDQDEFLSRALAEEAKVQIQEVDPDTGENVFTFREESKVPGSIAQLQVIPGSIEEAIDSLVIIYGLIRLRNADVHDFIRQYTKRPIANIEEILGSQNLAFDSNGNIDPNIEGDVVEGFHSRAFGDYNVDVRLPDREGNTTQAGKDALKALFPGVAAGSEVRRNAVIDRGLPPTAIKPELDPRGRARARVRAYVEELNLSRGLMG